MFSLAERLAHKRRIALHEAAHVVASYRLIPRVPVEAVALEPCRSGWTGHVQVPNVPMTAWELRAMAIVAYCGAAAVPGHQASPVDEQNAREALRQIGEEHELDRARRSAALFVSGARPQIEAVADALVLRNRLTGAEAQEIADRACDHLPVAGTIVVRRPH